MLSPIIIAPFKKNSAADSISNPGTRQNIASKQNGVMPMVTGISTKKFVKMLDKLTSEKKYAVTGRMQIATMQFNCTYFFHPDCDGVVI